MLPLHDDQLPLKLKKLIDPELQKYIDEPPGVGMGVIYAQISPSTKMYVGQHCHQGSGNSMRKNRLDKSKQPDCIAIHRAFCKYGPENIRTFIIARCPEGKKDVDIPGDSNALEKFFIGPEGLDTLAPNGYNLAEGGKNGKAHPLSKARMSVAQIERWSSMSPEKRSSISETIKSSKDVQYTGECGKEYKSKLSLTTTANNAKIRNDDILRTAMREKKSATRKNNQGLRDAKKWIPLMAAARDESDCGKVFEAYTKTLKRREVQNNSIARRKGYGNPPPPLSVKESCRRGRKKMAENMDAVVAKRKATRGY